MYSDLKDKVVLITGASKGIGRGIAQRFADEGVKLVLNYSSDAQSATETLKAIQEKGIDCVMLKADVSSPAAITELFDKAIQQYGKIDVVIANAGIELVHKSVLESTEADFDKVFNLNVKGTFFVMKNAARCLPDGGKLIVISSTMSIHPEFGAAIYASSKAASKLFVEVLAKELGPRQISVNTIMPGIIDNAGVIKDYPAEAKKTVIEGSPFRRLGTVEDVANVVVFLASKEGAYIHGHHLSVNGGSMF
jgi:3-oxoacyl-[acyl-carrier protein] reductase